MPKSSNNSVNNLLQAMNISDTSIGDKLPRTGLYGWICPKCGKSLSPSTTVCPCSSNGGDFNQPWYPYPTHPWPPTFVPESWPKWTVTNCHADWR